jgi:hypothetical protein
VLGFEGMHVFKARVVDGHLTLKEPTDLPEGTELELVPASPEDEMSPEERERLHAAIEEGIADIEAGRVISREELHRRLRARREA